MGRSSADARSHISAINVLELSPVGRILSPLTVQRSDPSVLPETISTEKDNAKWLVLIGGTLTLKVGQSAFKVWDFQPG